MQIPGLSHMNKSVKHIKKMVKGKSDNSVVFNTIMTPSGLPKIKMLSLNTKSPHVMPNIISKIRKTVKKGGKKRSTCRQK